MKKGTLDRASALQSLIPFLPDLAVISIVGTVLSAYLLVPPIIGLANNGDFYRLAPWCGAFYINGERSETVDLDGPDFVARTYRLGPIKNSQGFYSSSLPILWMARVANDTLGDDRFLDIRFVGAAHLVLLLTALFAFTSWFRALGWLTHVAVALVAIFVTTEVGYFSYFNSFYSEAASWLYLILALAAALRQGSTDASRRSRVLREVAYVLSCGLLVTAKPQNAVLGPVFVVLWWLLTQRAPGRERFRAGMVLSAVLLASSLLSLVLYQGRFVNLYNHTFFQILGDSPSVEDDLATLGLSSAYEELAGTHWFSPLPSPTLQELKESAAEQLHYWDLARFYAVHPARLGALLVPSSEEAFAFRPPLGNFERSAGKPPRELSAKLNHLSRLKQQIYPRKWWSLLLMMAVLAVPGCNVLLSRRSSAPMTSLALVSLGLVVMSLLEFLAASVARGSSIWSNTSSCSTASWTSSFW